MNYDYFVCRKSDDYLVFVVFNMDEVNIYLDSDRFMVIRCNFYFVDLF